LQAFNCSGLRVCETYWNEKDKGVGEEMYIRISAINPRDITFTDVFPNTVDAIVFRIEDNRVWRLTVSEWSLVYESKSSITAFYQMCMLMSQCMAMHAENLQREHGGFSEATFAEIVEKMQLIVAGNTM
jgi:hypothetical protein